MNNKSIDKTVEEKFPKDEYPIRIGVYVDKSGKTPSGFIDREAHQTFVNNIFETSPYSCNQD